MIDYRSFLNNKTLYRNIVFELVDHYSSRVVTASQIWHKHFWLKFSPLLLKAWQVGYNHLPQGGSAIYTGIPNEQLPQQKIVSLPFWNNVVQLSSCMGMLSFACPNGVPSVFICKINTCKVLAEGLITVQTIARHGVVPGKE